jgi:predicted nucleic-acid-binding protein
VFTLHRKYKVPKHAVVPLVTGVLAYRGLQVPGKELWRSALQTWSQHSIDFTDAYNVAYMQSLGVSEIYAWDGGYDRVPDVQRLEPTDELQEAEDAA